MKKKMLVLLVVLLLLASTTQAAFANPDPDPEHTPPTIGACHMGVSVWEPGTGPGNAYGVQPGERGMYHVHDKDSPVGYTPGASNMDLIAAAHCDFGQ